MGLVSVYVFLKKLYCGTGQDRGAENDEMFRKVTSLKSKSNFGGPAGGSPLERASPPKGVVLHDS